MFGFFFTFFCFIGNKKHNGGASVVCCDKNMEPRSCVNDCNARTCASLKEKRNTKKCSKKCYADKCDCKRGLYLNDCNECVPRDRCADSCKGKPIDCPGKHEELYPCYDPSFPRNCHNYWLNETACTPNSPHEVDLYDTPDSNAWWPEGQCILNVCDCRRGYYRNQCGICVQYLECDRPCVRKSHYACSDPHEKRYKEWRECEERSCVNLKHPLTCDSSTNRTHENKCDCKPGYRRDNCGRCVPKAECDDPRPCVCTNPCKERNKVLRCINSCTRRTCAKALSLPLICKEHCHYACDCLAEFWLNRHGICVSRYECTNADVRATAENIRDRDVKREGPNIFTINLPWNTV